LLDYPLERWDTEMISSGSSLISSSLHKDKEDDYDTREGNDTKSGDEQGQLENQIKTLKGEISQRQLKLNKLLSLKSEEGTTCACMLQSHEDCINSHLQKIISGYQPDLHQNEFPSIKQGLLQLIRDSFLNEYHHALSQVAYP